MSTVGMEWIRTSRRLPGNNGSGLSDVVLIVYRGSGEIDMSRLIYMDTGEEWECWHRSESMKQRKPSVLFWMPLPEAPFGGCIDFDCKP